MIWNTHFTSLKNDPIDVPNSLALSGVILDLIFIFTPDYDVDYAEHSSA